MIKIETKNLSIRNLLPNDFGRYWKFMTQESTKRSGSVKVSNIKDVEKQNFETRLKCPLEFGIVTNANKGQLLGCIQLSKLADANYDCKNTKKREIGMVLDENYQHKGIMTEATKAMIKFAFKSLDLTEVVAKILPNNEQSLKLAKRCGMQYLGHKIEYVGSFDLKEIEVFRITKEQFEHNPSFDDVKIKVSQQREK